MLAFKPSLATPVNWYDKSHAEAWTNHIFKITENNAAPPVGPPSQLWRLRLSDAAMKTILKLPEPTPSAPGPAPMNLAARALEVRAISTTAGTAGGIQHVSGPVEGIDHPLVPAAAATLRVNRIGPVESIGTAAPGPQMIDLHAAFVQQYHQLDVGRRLELTQFVGNSAPTQPVKTNSLAISFDYCLVNIRRPWLVDVFVNDRSWCIPNEGKGQVNAIGQAGNLSTLPIGFVAIRNLNIEANWVADDVASSSAATDFGPFKVSGEISNNKLSHPGLQIIGWLLQKMPDVPPNDPPATG
jgi:hypothetical protein